MICMGSQQAAVGNRQFPAEGKRFTTVKKQNYCIELFRFLFALCIMNFHFYHVFESKPDFFFQQGRIGVEFFFLVSGYLMAASAAKMWSEETDKNIGKTAIRFVLKKARAVIVPVYLAWVISFITIHVIEGQTAAVTWLTDGFHSIFELLFLRSTGLSGYYIVGQTWYISSMLLAMLICYPLLLKFKKTYLYCVAPLAALLILGFLSHEYNGLGNTTAFVGVVYKHFLRGIGVINLGVVCYAVANWLKKFQFTGFGLAVLSLLEIACYLGALFYMNWYGLPNQDFYVCLIMAIGVAITFAQRTWLNRLCDLFPAICRFLGKASLYVYLSHVLICRRIVPILNATFYSGWKIYCLGIAIIAGFTALLWILSFLVERYLLAFFKRILVKKVNV